MSRVMLNVTDIPAEGREFTFDDPGVWIAAWNEFGLPYTMSEPLRAELFILPEKTGFLVRGRRGPLFALRRGRAGARRRAL